jgi:hypothetical protein
MEHRTLIEPLQSFTPSQERGAPQGCEIDDPSRAPCADDNTKLLFQWTND